jgi:hopanoid-associated phosphorylase
MGTAAVTGMLAEARLLADLGISTVAAGGWPDATIAKIDQLIGAGATALLSFGIAGALDPALRPGDLVIGDSVIMPDERRIECDREWLARTRIRLEESAIAIGAVVGRSTAVDSSMLKAAIFRSTDALAVDMESHHVAAAAERSGLPFLVVRAVADTAADDLPPAALVGLNEEGRPAMGAVLRSLIMNPGQLPALVRAALRTRAALGTLLRCRAAIL